MARKPNYDYQKRQKEIARKEKQEAKRTRKREEQANTDAESPASPSVPAEEIVGQ
jgi:hypothetical protein